MSCCLKHGYDREIAESENEETFYEGECCCNLGVISEGFLWQMFPREFEAVEGPKGYPIDVGQYEPVRV